MLAHKVPLPTRPILPGAHARADEVEVATGVVAILTGFWLLYWKDPLKAADLKGVRLKVVELRVPALRERRDE